MFVVYEVVNDVKWEVKRVETEGGAKRSVTCAMKRASKSKANPKLFGYMSAVEWANRKVPMKTVKNLMSGKDVVIAADTPRCCDPSSELYWSM